MQFSSKQIVFQYQQGKHLSTILTLTNKQNFNQLFKFKASTVNRFIIKPNVGSVQPGQRCPIQIVIHKDIVQNFQNQRIQLLYGKNLQDNKQFKSHMFQLNVVNNQQYASNLDLTTMVQAKQTRIKQLQTQVRELKMTQPSGQKTKKSSKILLKLILAIIIGLIIGFFGPLKIFKKKIIRKIH